MKTSLSRHVGNFDVCIVGAGLSGAYAAHLLVHADKTVAIIDSRERVGGRLLSACTGGGGDDDDGGGGSRSGRSGGDLGGAWVWPESEIDMVRFMMETNVATTPMRLAGHAMYRGPDGIRHVLPPGSSGRYAACGEGAVRISGGAASMVEKLLLPPGRRHRRMSTSSSGDDDDVGGAREDGRDRPSLHLGRRVVRVERDEDDDEYGVNVTYVESGKLNDGGDREEREDATSHVRCRAAILAGPPRVLASTIDFRPPLPKDKMDVMLSTPTWMEEYGKVDVSFPVNWWRSRDMSGISIDQRGAVSTWWEACSDVSRPSLAGFVSSRDAGALVGMIERPESLHEYVLDSLIKLYGVDGAEMGMARDATDATYGGSVDGNGLVVVRGGIAVTYKSWLMDPNTNAPSCNKADATTTTTTATTTTGDYGNGHLRQSVGPLFFAGTETSRGSGHMEGAIISARRAADEVIRYLG
jgi:monoamine oxidase